MNILEVPRILFEEFSKKIGIGEEWEKRVKYDGIRDGVFRLKGVMGIPKVAEYPETKFEQVIGFRDDSDREGLYFIFALWGLVPQGLDDHFESALRIIARPADAGVWAYGLGKRIKLTCKAEFGYYGMALSAPSSKLIPVILQRAVELASAAETEVYWEKERHPEGNYDRPPR